MSNEKELARSYKSIREDYTFDPSIFSGEDGRVALVKYIINHRIPEVDRILILLYTDCHSLRKLGDRLGLSHQTCAKEIRRIRREIIDEYERLKKYEPLY